MQTAIQRRWLALSDTERKLARQTVDWQHNQSQMSDEDRDHAYDCAWAWQDLKLKPAQMRGIEIWSAHKTSDLIMSIHRSIWFNLHRNA